MEEDKNKALEYISERLKDGMSESDIKMELIKTGWSEEAADTMLSGFRDSKKKKAGNKWIANLVIAGAIVLFGISSAYFFVFRNADILNENDTLETPINIPVVINSSAGSNTNTDSQDVNTITLPIPDDFDVIATVNDQEFLYEDFAENFTTMKHFYNLGPEGNDFVNSDDYIIKIVLTRMIREYFLDESVREHKILILPKEINDEFDTLVEQTGSRDEAIESINQLYNWDESIFKEKIIRPFIQEEKLRLYIATDTVINANKYILAQEAVNFINAGDITFENAVPIYSDDINTDVAGDLGYISRNEALPEIENAAFSLDVGEISEIIPTLYGFHILKVTNKSDSSGPSPDRVRISHILFKTIDYDEWFIEQLARRRIAIFAEGYEWRDECAAVIGINDTCADAAIPSSLRSSLE